MTLKLLRLASLLFAVLLMYPIGLYAQKTSYRQAISQIEELEASISKLAKAKDWEGHLQAYAKILAIHRQSKNYTEGIELGEELIRKTARKPKYLQSYSWPIYQELALLYKAVLKPHHASELYLQQIELLTSYPKSNQSWQLVSTYNELGSYYLSLKQVSKALTYLHEAESAIQAIPKVNPSAQKPAEVMMQTYRSLSEAYVQQESIQQALPYAKLALQVAQQYHLANALALQPYYSSIGKLYFTLEEYEKSREYHRKAIYILSNGNPSQADAPIIRFALANSYSDLADAIGEKEAIEYYQKSLDLTEDTANYLLLRIKNLRKIAERFNWEDDFVQAWPYIQQADSLWLANEPYHAEDPAFQFARAGIYRSTGHYWKRLGYFHKALHFYKKYVEVWERNGSTPVNTESIGILMEIAEIYNWKVTEKDMYADSAVYYTRKALVKASKNFDSYDPKELPPVEDLHTITYMYAILKQLARFGELKAMHYGNEEDKKEALRNALSIMDLADQFHTRSLQQMNSLRAGQVAGLIRRSLMIYHGSIVFGINLYQLEPSPDLLDKCFYYSQRMKAQKLWLAQLEEEAHKLLDLPNSLRTQEKALSLNIQAYEKAVRQAHKNGDSLLVERLRNNQLFTVRRAYEALQLQLERNHPTYRQNKYNFIPTTISELQQQLQSEELLVEYLLSEWEQFAFVVQKDKPAQLIALAQDRATCTSVFERIEQMHDLLQRSAMHRKNSRVKFIQWGHELYQHFLNPFEESLIGKKRLILVGHDRISYIPFETLLSSAEVKPFTELEYLIKNYEISYHYSANLFVQSRRKQQTLEEGVYVFAPIYDAREILGEAPEPTRIPDENKALRAFDDDGLLTPLPESEREAKNIFELFAAGKDPVLNRIALREVATEYNLKANLAAPYRFIHIAGHSFANLKNPELSGIACIAEDSQTEEDGILYMGEIYNLNTKADLVTLSSCESGLGKLDGADGLVGLNRAFIYAGIPNVVFSLWKVYDRVSSTFMVAFYESVLEGENYATSLRRAKLKLLESESTASPHYWSPFLLIGR